ncbi:hypothetical protein FHR33_009832 [Nonomuraea dietziae]|uniref:Uncharacterized protein n=1 Tax=Nonomuraea dietziae TaxID=65515 RepID=A0A7W5VLJ2_9ACTN|nr:hypothetical protein [Nonomuraea dietziae]
MARDLGLAESTVRKRRAAFARGGLEALTDEARTGRPKSELTVSDAERAVLQRWAWRAGSAQVLAMRAKIVLACADGTSNKQIPSSSGCIRTRRPNGAVTVLTAHRLGAGQ